jgi:hypothetical protein
MRNCTRDEGRPFEVDNQVLISSPPQAAVVKSNGGERCGNVESIVRVAFWMTMKSTTYSQFMSINRFRSDLGQRRGQQMENFASRTNQKPPARRAKRAVRPARRA